MTRHFFPGGNTPLGFYNLFDSISCGGERTIHIKGASGCGKSTFMKKAAETFESMGFDVERFHCSNDAQSLDGVRVPKAGVSIVDATAPHVSDPAIPVAHDEIFNMADFINQKMVSKHKNELESLTRQKKQYFTKAYHYLAAAGLVVKNNEAIYKNALDQSKLNAAIMDALSTFEGMYSSAKAGKNRKLFASAVTPDGYINYTDSLLDEKITYVLSGEMGMGADIFLDNIRNAANLRGFDTESLHCPMNPGKTEHLIIPGMDLCFTTKNKHHSANVTNQTKEINFDDFLDEEAISKAQSEIEYNTSMFDELTGKAIKILAEQRVFHERIEEIYIPAMDFERLTIACDKIIAEMVDCAKML